MIFVFEMHECFIEMWVGTCSLFDKFPEGTGGDGVFYPTEFCIADVKIMDGQCFDLFFFFFFLEFCCGVVITDRASTG